MKPITLRSLSIILLFAVFCFIFYGCNRHKVTDADTPVKSGPSTQRVANRDSGEYLMRAANCYGCHTFNDKEAFAEPDKIQIGFEPLSEAAFAHIVREGIGPEGNEIAPIMPYEYYVGIRDADISKMYDYYINTVNPPERPPRDTKLQERRRFEDNTGKSEEYNRGAYLATALGHCGACHSPVGEDKPLSGGDSDGWIAYNITSDPNAGIGDWTQEDLRRYFTDGVNEKGHASGAMGNVVGYSLYYMEDEDRDALALYLLESTPYNNGETKPRHAWGSPLTDFEDLRHYMAELDKPDKATGKFLYSGFCATCHGMSGEGSPGETPSDFPSLIHNTTVGAPTADNIAAILLEGSMRQINGKEIFMPAVGTEMTDEEIVLLVNFISEQFGNPDAVLDIQDIRYMR